MAKTRVRFNPQRQTYQAVFYFDLPSGRKIRNLRRSPPESITSESAAIRWASAWQQEAIRLDRLPDEEEPEELTFKEFCDKYLELHFAGGRKGPLKPSQKLTINMHLTVHIFPALGDVPLSKINSLEIDKFVHHLQMPYKRWPTSETMRLRSLKTINNILTTLQTLLRRAERWGQLDRAPKIELFRRPKPPPKFWSFAEWKLLVDGASEAGPYALAAVLLGGRAGLRAGEMIALEWRDLDLAKGLVRIRSSETKGEVSSPKGGRDFDVVELREEVVGALKALPRKGARVFQRDTEKGGNVSIQTLRQWIWHAERNAGLGRENLKGRIHLLRHTLASHLVQKGVPLREVQRVLRHEDYSTTLQYAHLAPDAAKSALSALD